MVAEMVVSTLRMAAGEALTSKVLPLRTAPTSPQPVTFSLHGVDGAGVVVVKADHVAGAETADVDAIRRARW